MSRPGEARLAKVKRRASVPKAGCLPGIPSCVFLRSLGLLRVHQAGGALFDQLVEADAVDQVDRVEHVALRLRHLLAFGIADQAMHIDVLERDLAGDVLGHHDHARDPEEDDVEAGDQHGRRQIVLQDRVGGVDGLVAASSPASRTATGRRSTRCRARPGRASGRRCSPAWRPRHWLRPRCGRRKSGRRRRTRPESGGPTRAGAKCTSPGCC